jgi:hypothetical protein
MKQTLITALKEEMKSMKASAEQFQNADYATGYICAISTLEGFLSLKEAERTNDEKEPSDL